jgi:hypothetical protein
MQPKTIAFKLTSLALLSSLTTATTIGHPGTARAAGAATITVTTNLDHADLFAPDITSNGVCTDTVRVTSGLIPVPVYGCSLRSALKTAFETPENDTIVFAPALNGTVFALKGTALNWAASGVLVDAQGQTITLNGAGMNAGANMIEIGGNGNLLRGVALTAARANALVVGDQAGVGAGNDNVIHRVSVYGNPNGIGASIVGSGAPGGARNVILESLFGRPVSGTACDPARANSVNIRVSEGAVDTRITNNEIMCGDVAGVQIVGSGTSGTNVSYNSIGFGISTGEFWGNGVGVSIQLAQKTVVLGNYIRCSATSGIIINGASTNDVRLINNYIGDIDRGPPFGVGGENTIDGIFVDGVTRLDGNFFDNVIYGNGGDGIRINASSVLTLESNTIGFPDTRFNARNINGVSVTGGSQRVYLLNNTIGYNENLGVWINGENSDNNGVAGNTILGHGNTGVQIDGGADFNAIGARAFGLLGVADVAGNTIISNTREGIYIAGATTEFNLVADNEIGAQGKYSYPNGFNGIVLANGARNNQIGAFIGIPLGNTIVSNGDNGILVDGASNNTIQTNSIGSIPSVSEGGSPNGYSGIYITGASTGNIIGGDPNASNRIAYNANDGITLSGSGATNNTIRGNHIYRNSANGITIDAAPGNLLNGDPDSPIALHENLRSGVYIAAGANNTSLSRLSVDNNVHYGVLIDNSSSTTLANVSATGNGYDGIGERNGATNNAWSQLATGNNNGLGIDKDASNDAANVVAASTITITAYTVGDGNMSLGGLAPSTSYEVYVADADPSGYGEGARVAVAFSTGPSASTATVNIPASDRANNCFTVLKTTTPSSEFSQNYCRLTPQSIDHAPAGDRTLAQPLSFTQYATATSGLPVSFVGFTPGICTVTAAGIVTISGVGLCGVRLEQAGDATYGPATPVVVTFNVTKAPQTIAPIWPGDIRFGSGPVTYALNASSNLPVTLASTTPAVCTVSGLVVTPVAVGLCSLVASQAGDATYSAAPDLAFNVAVVPGSQTISFAQPGDVGRNASPTVVASASSGLPVSFSGGTPGVCAVAPNGRVTPLGIGVCSVTATQPGNANYAAAPSVTRSFTIRFVTLLPLMRKV